MRRDRRVLWLALLVPAAVALASSCREEDSAAAEDGSAQNGATEVKVYTIGSDVGGGPVVILSDKDEKTFLPIGIGPCEAFSISNEMNGRKPPRPMTHDLLKSIIDSLDGTVTRIVVTDMKYDLENRGTYHARIVVKTKSETLEIDARPSDAIALALRTAAPIFVSKRVMEENGIENLPQQEEGEGQGKEGKKKQRRRIGGDTPKEFI